MQHEDVLDGSCEEENSLRPTCGVRKNQNPKKNISKNSVLQMIELANNEYEKFPAILQKHMDAFHEKVGRKYELFTYLGDPNATHVIVIMGSGFFVVKDYIDRVLGENSPIQDADRKKIGVLGVHLFNPWSPEAFVEKLPVSVQHISIVDKTKEYGSQGEPLFCQVATTLMTSGRGAGVQIYGGRYGLGSRDFTPKHVHSIFCNMMTGMGGIGGGPTEKPKRRFTVGITDDVSNLSLEVRPEARSMTFFPPDVVQAVFWGFGSDGTVGGNKSSIKIIGDYATQTEVQGYFEYDAKKSGGLTVSFLRFCVNKGRTEPYKIEAPYKIGEDEADFVACHNETYVESHKYHVSKFLKGNGEGIFLLNTAAATIEDHEKLLRVLSKTVSPRVLYDVARKKPAFGIGLGTG